MKWCFVILATGIIGCGSVQPEGADPKECSDLKDNDNDGKYDCDDDGCALSDHCVEQKRLQQIEASAAAAAGEKAPIEAPLPSKIPAAEKKEEPAPYYPLGPIWVQLSQNGENINWYDAAQYCEKLNLAGISGWRLPTQKEAVNIVESGLLTNEPSYVMWTSTKMGTKRAVIVGITGGAVNHLAVQSKGDCRARCVRDAK